MFDGGERIVVVVWRVFPFSSSLELVFVIRVLGDYVMILVDEFVIGLGWYGNGIQNMKNRRLRD